MEIENPKYKHQLKFVLKTIQEIASKVFLAHKQALDGFMNKDIVLLNSVKHTLKGIEQDANDLDNKIINILALFDPEATELRKLISCLKIINELINIGNDAKSYAKNIKEAFEENIDIVLFTEYILTLHKSAIASVKYALDSLYENSLDFENIFVRAKIEESKTDDLCSLLEKELLEQSQNNQSINRGFGKILNTIKKLEKTADRAVNITNLVIYANRGGKIKSY